MHGQQNFIYIYIPLQCSQQHTIRCFPELAKSSPQLEAIFLKYPFLNIVVHFVFVTDVTDFEAKYALCLKHPFKFHH